MSEDYFDFVCLNNDTIILHGQYADGRQFYRPLDETERERVFALDAKHCGERNRLLRELAA